MSDIAQRIRSLQQDLGRKRRDVLLGLATLILAGFALTLIVGQSVTPPGAVLRVLGGASIPGAAFVVWDLRLPRSVVSILAGMSFGMGGVAFQLLLRNPLASPDIIGISAGASTAAVFCIVILSLSGTVVAVAAIFGGLGVALLIYLLSWRQGVTGARLILVGIGLAAMMQSVTAYVLSKAPAWSFQEALRWMTGSVNGAQIWQALPLICSLALFGVLLLLCRRELEILRLGDEIAAGLGVRLGLARMTIVLAAVGLVATATAMAGPIAFVAFLSGPIAARITGRHGSLLVPSACVGAVLVLFGDYIGQHLLPARYPVGIVTGVLGAPYLIFMVTRESATGATL